MGKFVLLISMAAIGIFVSGGSIVHRFRSGEKQKATDYLWLVVCSSGLLLVFWLAYKDFAFQSWPQVWPAIAIGALLVICPAATAGLGWLVAKASGGSDSADWLVAIGGAAGLFLAFVIIQALALW